MLQSLKVAFELEVWFVAQEELAEFRRTGKGYRKEMEGGFPMFPGEAPPGHPYPHAFAGHRS